VTGWPSRRNAAWVGEPGAAQYTISRWPLSGMCSTRHSNSSGPVSGFRTPQQGAEVSVHLATLPDDGPSGVLWGYVWTADGTESYGVLPW
jgi:hypothetical protein